MNPPLQDAGGVSVETCGDQGYEEDHDTFWGAVNLARHEFLDFGARLVDLALAPPPHAWFRSGVRDGSKYAFLNQYGYNKYEY